MRERLSVSFSRVFPALLGALLCCAATAAVAQAPPRLRILVGFPAGGGTDVIARRIADRLSGPLGAPVLVENRAGAGGQLAAQALKAAAADGATVLFSHDHAISILPLVSPDAGYDPRADFAAVAGIATFANAFAVSAATPAQSFAEYLAWVRAQGVTKAAVGIPAPLSTPDFLVRTLARRHAIEFAAAAYRGSAPMIADLMGNQIPAGIGSVAEFIDLQRDGRVRVLAVLGRQRQALLPAVPTFGELGVGGFEDAPYYGFFMPAATPAPARARLAGALQQVLAEPALRAKLGELGLAVEFEAGPQFAQRIDAYTRAWAALIRQSGFVLR